MKNRMYVKTNPDGTKSLWCHSGGRDFPVQYSGEKRNALGQIDFYYVVGEVAGEDANFTVCFRPVEFEPFKNMVTE